MTRRAPASGRPVVIKVGSSSLGRGGSGLAEDAIGRAVGQVEAAWRAGHPAVLVTSGAVAAGMASLGLARRPADVVELQVAAAVGQGLLMHRYTAEFAERGRIAGQVLLTKAILSDRDQYLNARNALERMLAHGIVPIVNENDTVAVEELRLGDNDRLAAIVSHLVGAGLLILLTDTVGLLSADPRVDEGATLVDVVAHNDEELDRLAAGGKGPLGSGGVATKVLAARMAAFSGVPTVIGPADRQDAVAVAIRGGDIGTWVDPRRERLPARKLWIAFGQRSLGRVTVDDGAREALVRRSRSLLPVGVVGCEGQFEAGDAVEVFDLGGRLVAKGIARLSAGEVAATMGRRSENGELINRDDLVVLVEARTGEG